MLNKKASNTLLEDMQKNLSISEEQRNAINNLDKAVDDINIAVSILDDLELSKHADSLLKVLVKIAFNSKDDDEKKLNSLLQEDEMFSLSEDNINDLLFADTDEPDYLSKNLSKDEVEFEDVDFEDVDFEDE